MNETGLLVLRNQITITLSERHDPNAYYRNRLGLHVWRDFPSRVVSKAKPTEAGASFKVNVSDFGRKATTDKEIERALPKSHLFDESAVCAVIAKMISRQPNGEPGDLDATSYVNLFYIASCVIYMGRDRASRTWYASTQLRGAGVWYAGRVLYPST